MAMSSCKEVIDPCPDNIAVVGGGRWARVLTEELFSLVPLSVRILVCSPRNAESMSAWVDERGLRQRVKVSSKWPQLDPLSSNAVIVVNAARDHEKAIERALTAGIPVLVEKPITLTATASQRLAELAYSRGVGFASAHIFLFAKYLENFSNLIAAAGDIKSMRMQWMDPQTETRHGEKKQYDPSLPVFADVLPHVLSIGGILLPNLPQRCEALEFLRGGAHLNLNLKFGDIPCDVALIRNGGQRQRVLEVVTMHQTFQLDFSKEPGSIISGFLKLSGDPDWEIKMRPVAQLLVAFLKWVAGGEPDSRLGTEIGLRANQVIDQTFVMYNEAFAPWLVAKLAFLGRVDDDLRYALNEMLLVNESLSTTEIESQIGRVQRKFSGDTATDLLRALNDTRDPLKFVGLIARESDV